MGLTNPHVRAVRVRHGSCSWRAACWRGHCTARLPRARCRTSPSARGRAARRATGRAAAPERTAACPRPIPSPPTSRRRYGAVQCSTVPCADASVEVDSWWAGWTGVVSVAFLAPRPARPLAPAGRRAAPFTVVHLPALPVQPTRLRARMSGARATCRVLHATCRMPHAMYHAPRAAGSPERGSRQEGRAAGGRRRMASGCRQRCCAGFVRARGRSGLRLAEVLLSCTQYGNTGHGSTARIRAGWAGGPGGSCEGVLCAGGAGGGSGSGVAWCLTSPPTAGAAA